MRTAGQRRTPRAIAGIALLLVAIILILGDHSFKTTEKASFDEFNQRQLVLAREAASGIEIYFDHLAGAARTLGRIPEVQQFDEAQTRRELRRRFDELEPLGVNDIGVLDASGVLRYNVAAPQIEDTDFSWRTYYQEAKGLASSDTHIVEFIEFKGVEAGQRGVIVAVPMFQPDAEANANSPSGPLPGWSSAPSS